MPQTITEIKPRRFQCRHIFTDGHRCGSPCLRHEDFCFYHHTAHARRAVPTVDLSQGEHRADPFTLPIPEDRSAIQQAIGEILNRLSSNALDPRRAGLLLYGLQIASLNLPQTKPSARRHGHEEEASIEEVVTDPTHGTVAPLFELPDPDAPRKDSLTDLLLKEIRKGHEEIEAEVRARIQAELQSQSQPESESEPTTLPTLTAAAHPALKAVIPSEVEEPASMPANAASGHPQHRTPQPTRLAILSHRCPNPSSSPSSTAGATSRVPHSSRSFRDGWAYGAAPLLANGAACRIHARP